MSNNKYSVALCILTYERSELVRDFLINCAEYYIDAGIDVYFYDSSISGETKNAVLSWPDKEHVFYVGLPTDISLNKKEYLVLQKRGLKKDYDFISISNDATQHSREALGMLAEWMSLEYDFIDLGFQSKLETEVFDEPNEYLLKCVESTMHMGSSFVNVHFMLDDVDWSKYEALFCSADDLGWYNMGAYFVFYYRRFLELENFSALHLEITKRMRRSSALKRESFYDRDMIHYVCEGWINTFSQLSDYYTNCWKACLSASSSYTMCNISDFVFYRYQGIFSIRDLLKYWSVWPKVTRVLRRQLFFVSFIPRGCIVFYYEARKRRGLRKLRDFCGKYLKTAIYGTGNHGTAYAEYLKKQGIRFDCFCVSSRKQGKNTHEGLPVYTLSELDLKNTGFIIALHSLNANEVLPVLRQRTTEEHILYEPDLERLIRLELGRQAFSSA